MPEDADYTDSASARPRDPFRGIRRFVFGMGVLFIGWVLLGRSLPYATPGHHAETVPNPPATGVETRSAFTSYAQPPQPAPAPPAGNNPALEERLAQLQAKVDALQQAAAPAVDDTRLKRFEDKLDQQEAALIALKSQLSRTEAASSQHLAALAAFEQLKEHVERGEPYAAELPSLKQLMQDKPDAQKALDALAPNGEQGIASLAQLRGLFDASVKQALSPAQGIVMNQLASLIRIRKTGAEQQGNDDQAIIARAEAFTHQGDTESASRELAALSPQAAPAFAEWIKKAQARAQAQQALGALQLALMHDMAPPTPAPSQ